MKPRNPTHHTAPHAPTAKKSLGTPVRSSTWAWVMTPPVVLMMMLAVLGIGGAIGLLGGRYTTTIIITSAAAHQPQPQPPMAGDAVVRKIAAPVGVTAIEDILAVQVAWVPGPESTVPADGFLVYYWRADAGFATVQRHAQLPQSATTARLANLLPDTEYRVAVRAATRSTVIGVERIGDWFLSGFSDLLAVRTKPAIECRLLGGSARRAVIEVKRFMPTRNEWIGARFVVGQGDAIGGAVSVNNVVEDFRTPYTLDGLAVETVYPTTAVAGAVVAEPLTGPDGRPLLDVAGQRLDWHRPAHLPPRARLVATLRHADGRQLRLIAPN